MTGVTGSVIAVEPASEQALGLPPGWRPLTFRYAGSCGAQCGGPAVQAGERGFWNPETKEVRHAWCPPSADRTAGRRRSLSTGLPTPRDDWQRLVAYCRACVLREALAEPPGYDGCGERWGVVPAGPEQILAGVSRCLEVSAPIRRVVGALTADDASADRLGVRRPARGQDLLGEELAYGWPLVVCRADDRSVRCAPLLIAAAEPPSEGAQEITVDLESAQLNAAVADPRFQPDADPTLLQMIADDPLPLGDPRALADRLTKLAGDASLRVIEPLDASALTGGQPPREPGVYNRAIVLRRGPTRMTLNLLADLRDLFYAPETQWSKTAAAWLVRGSAPAGSRAVAVVSANPLNASQEAGVQAALGSPISVVTGPPGTGKSQFVAALVTTARDNGLTILVTSTNNGAVDAAVDRAASAHPATILRTGSARYRTRLTATVDAISREAPSNADPDGARASHRAVTVRRDQARAALAARAQELGRLDAAAGAVASLARVLWGGPACARVAEDPAGVLERAGRVRGWWRRRARGRLLAGT
jgi:hypothetical protein